MRYFPINIDIRGKRVVVVGGGAVAARKCQTLLAADAQVIVIAPILADSLRELVDKGVVRHLARQYKKGDIAGAFLVFAATDSHSVNQAVAKEGKNSGVLTDVADAPDTGDFTSPAVISRGELMITISTEGKSPLLARRIREELEELYGTEFAVLIKLFDRVREKLLTENKNSSYNKKILFSLLEHDLPALLKNRSAAEIDNLLRELCGPGFSLAELGMGEKDRE
jgi:precorrin-2 dehydrogenase/sirohydrochlorin ferrochelatase